MASTKNLVWILIFLGVVGGPLFACAVLSIEITRGKFLLIVLTASISVQLMTRRTLSDLYGKFDVRWLFQLVAGGSIGLCLMVVPSIFLYFLGQVSWTKSEISYEQLAWTTLAAIEIAVAQEFLFRGFIFQRLIDVITEWPAQIVVSLIFVSAHYSVLSEANINVALAVLNLFFASLLFGISFIATRRLAMPIGIHFGANFAQAVLLGLSVSGKSQQGLLQPVFLVNAPWLSGGDFGLEGSALCLLAVMGAFALIYERRRYLGEC